MNEKKILDTYFNKNIVSKLLKHKKLRDIQKKSLKYLFDQNLIISSPTGSGKSWIAEVAVLHTILNKNLKAIYITPLKALAKEKYNKFKEYNTSELQIALSTGDYDESDEKLSRFNLIITTSEKMDSIIRHKPMWLNEIGILIFDEIHILNDIKRGPTLEFVISYFKDKHIIGLSATISNAKEIAEWLNAKLIFSNKRPVKLRYGVLKNNNEIYFNEKTENQNTNNKNKNKKIK